MSSYNTRSEFANADQRFGYEAVIAGAIAKAAGLTLIKSNGSYRLPHWPEQQGIAMAENDIAIAERLAAGAFDLDAISFWAEQEPLEAFPWDAYADAVCTCRPDSVMACPACLDASAARWGDEIPF
jgi:hypothetical protein